MQVASQGVANTLSVTGADPLTPIARSCIRREEHAPADPREKATTLCAPSKQNTMQLHQNKRREHGNIAWDSQVVGPAQHVLAHPGTGSPGHLR